MNSAKHLVSHSFLELQCDSPAQSVHRLLTKSLSVVYVVNVVYLTTSPRMQCYVESGSVPVKVVIRKTK